MTRKQATGFALLEVLVTIIILALGLLGLAGLQNKLVVAEIESYQRSQALTILQDMVNRLNTNRQNAAAYAGTEVGGADEVPTCNGLTGANLDVCQWQRLLLGTTERKGGTEIGTISGAIGCIDSLGGGQYRVSVAWQGFNATTPPAVACGEDAFGDESLRRVVTEVVRIANLACDPATPGTC